ncbi:hypothetical protein YC2023_054713 [Brassica napus]
MKHNNKLTGERETDDEDAVGRLRGIKAKRRLSIWGRRDQRENSLLFPLFPSNNHLVTQSPYKYQTLPQSLNKHTTLAPPAQQLIAFYIFNKQI